MQLSLDAMFAPKKGKPATKVNPKTVDLIDEAPVSTDCSHIFDSPEDFANCLEPGWRSLLKSEFKKPYFNTLLDNLRKETRKIYPPKSDILNAFNMCPLDKIKVVIIGQDPYHEEGQAMGLSFSVRKGVAIPASLKNIYKELSQEYGAEFQAPNHGNLESWANQGILMLNAALTVAASDANSHSKYGWSEFTKAVIKVINDRLEHVVFLLWGGFAKKVASGVDKSKHCILTSGHPSPLSVQYFMGNNHFKKTNEYLLSVGKTPINWNSINTGI